MVLTQIFKSASGSNTMDKIMVRVDENTLLPIKEFLNETGFQDITERIQKDLKTLYHLNNRKPPLFQFPDFPPEKPLIIDCSTATTDDCQAHYITGEHVVEFQERVHEDFRKKSGYSLLSTLAHELKHAEQDVPAIWSYKNALQYHQLGFLEEAQAFAFSRYVMNLVGEPDPSYREVLKKHTDEKGIVDEKAVETEILQQELNRLFNDYSYKSRYDGEAPIVGDENGITEIPKEFNFPNTALLYQIIQKTPREPLEPEKVKYKETPPLNYFRKYPTLIQKPEIFKDYDKACWEVLLEVLKRWSDYATDNPANVDLKLFETALKAKNEQGEFICSHEDLMTDLKILDYERLSQESFIRAPGDVMVSPKELFVLFENGDISREELITTFEYHNAGRRLKDLAITTTADGSKLDTPIADSFTYRYDVNGNAESATGFKDNQITSYTQYYNGKKVNAYYFLSDKDKENLNEWVTSEAWMEYGPHNKPCYARTVFDKKEGISRTLFYSNEHMTEFLYGIRTENNGKTQRCNEAGKVVNPSFWQSARNRLFGTAKV